MRDKTCGRMRQDLVAYLDGELDSRAQRRIEEHLGHCARCGEELDPLRGTERLVRAFFAEAAPEGQWSGALARARRALGARRKRPQLVEFLGRLLEEPVHAFAATVFVSVAMAGALDLLGLEEAGLRALAYLLSVGLS